MEFKALREFAGLSETEKAPYLINHGNKLILNIVTFPAMPHSGIIMRAHGITLVGLLAARFDSEPAEAAYQAELSLCHTTMEDNYNDIDLVAAGSEATILLAGVRAYSTITARTGSPAPFGDIKYVITSYANQIKIEWDADDLAYGSIMITTTDMTVSVEQSGPLQLKVTVGSAILFIDLITKHSVVVEHLIGGSVTKTSGVSFNPNGMNPVVNLKNVVVPLP